MVMFMKTAPFFLQMKKEQRNIIQKVVVGDVTVHVQPTTKLTVAIANLHVSVISVIFVFSFVYTSLHV